MILTLNITNYKYKNFFSNLLLIQIRVCRFFPIPEVFRFPPTTRIRFDASPPTLEKLQ